MGKGGRDNLVRGGCNPSFFFQMLETKSALKNHKTQAQCVVSSPTATPCSYPPIRRRTKKDC